MKKAILLLGAIIAIFLSTGCVFEENPNIIYTTNYPITYITSFLYGKDDNIKSIYPNEIDINKYVLTKKMVKEYAKSNIFVYDGLSNEKDYAKKLINTNHRLNIIDATENLTYMYDSKETWLSPDNFLMLCKNIKNRLLEISTSQEEMKTINDNYKILEQEISNMDAYLRSIATNATKDGNKPTLVAATNDFKYLEDYGFEVIVLDDNLSENYLISIKANFNNKKYNEILAFDGYKNSELVNSIVNEYEAKIVNVNPIYTLSNDDISKNETFITLMNNYIETIRSIVS